jgi:hypothetical protein
LNQIRFFQIVILISFLSFGATVFSQSTRVPNLKLYDDDPLHFGFILAANQMGFIIKNKENLPQLYFKGDQIPQFDIGVAGVDSASVFGIQADPMLGFTVGIVGDRRLGEYFNFRVIPSLAFGSRDLQYDTRLYKKINVGEDNEKDTIITRVLTQKVNSTFVEFPFYLKYKSKRSHNMRAYVIGGIKYSFDLASQAHKADDKENDYEVKLFRSDSYYMLGAGLDFYMNWFKFGIELSMSYGVRDMLLREDNLYTDGIESLRSKIFMFTFTFE